MSTPDRSPPPSQSSRFFWPKFAGTAVVAMFKCYGALLYGFAHNAITGTFPGETSASEITPPTMQLPSNVSDRSRPLSDRIKEMALQVLSRDAIAGSPQECPGDAPIIPQVKSTSRVR